MLRLPKARATASPAGGRHLTDKLLPETITVAGIRVPTDVLELRSPPTSPEDDVPGRP